MLKEFKAFVMKGNVLDLAVAVIMGGALNARQSKSVAPGASSILPKMISHCVL